MMIAKSNVATATVTKINPEKPADPQPLAFHVKQALERYFAELDGQPPHELYELVLCEVERPLLEVVMHYTRGNLSKAAQYLGLNRATLRKKLEKYKIAT
jgi:DNA-binding protein Fis